MLGIFRNLISFQVSGSQCGDCCLQSPQDDASRRFVPFLSVRILYILHVTEGKCFLFVVVMYV